MQTTGTKPWNYAIHLKDNKMVRRKYSLNSCSRLDFVVYGGKSCGPNFKYHLMGKFHFLSLG